MRRCLHSLLVGVLTFSLAIDAARACGHRRSCAAPCHGASVVVPAMVAWDGCGCGVVVVATVIHGCPSGCEEIACGTPLDCCCPSVAVTAAPAAGVVDARPAPTASSPTAQSPTPAEVAPAAESGPHAPEPLATVPDLAPVAPASATEPEPEMPAEDSSGAAAEEDTGAADEEEEVMEELAEAPVTEPEMEEPVPAVEEPAAPAEPAPQPEPPPAPEPPSEPPRRNPFDEDEAAAADADVPAADAPPASADVVPADAQPMKDATTEAAPVAEPALDDALPFDAPATEPADDPAGEPAPAAEPEPVAEPETAAAVEPQRRWIDATGSFAVVGRLVAVQGDAVEILRADGRGVSVPLARLSEFDRDYVAEAGSRVAAARQPGPRPTDTVQR